MSLNSYRGEIIMLSPEFEDFYRSWLQKAEEYEETDLRQCFDKFFTLFVVYNRLYAEATFTLARKGEINLATRYSFPDSMAAKSYVQKYLGGANLLSKLEDNEESKQAIATIRNLIEDGIFNIKLNMVTGNSQREADLELLKSLKSTNRGQRARAILDIIYSIRCNMFHGHKGFTPVQVKILRPVITVLENIIRALCDKLSTESTSG